MFFSRFFFMACRRKLNTSGIYALIRMIVTTFNPKQANQDKGNFHTKLIKQTKQIKTEKARKRQLNSFSEREKVHVIMS